MYNTHTHTEREQSFWENTFCENGIWENDYLKRKKIDGVFKHLSILGI